MRGEGGKWVSEAAQLYVFYVSWMLLEVHLYVFFVSGRLRGRTDSKGPMTAGGSARKDLTRAGGGERARGGSGERSSVFYVSWRLLEAHL